MTITASQVKELRDKTGLPMMKCKRALEENNGDISQAEEALRKQGMKTEARGGRTVNEGTIGSYVHHNGRIGVLLEVGCETDFVAKNEDFKALVKVLAEHIAACKPSCVSREDVSQELIDKEKDIYRAQIEGKPENIVEKILEGKIDAFYKEICLLEQPFIDDGKMSVQEYINTLQMKLGENISVNRFVRFEIGQ